MGRTIDSARAEILAATGQLSGTEAVVLERAGGRVLAETIKAPHDLPPFAASAMDGYAAMPCPAGTLLKVIGEARAGRPFDGGLSPGEAIIISTGAKAPEGAGVAPVETVEPTAEGVRLEVGIAALDHVRLAGEDLREGAVALEPGDRLDPASLALAAACGIAEVTCAAQPRVAIIVTGDELVRAGDPLGPGQIHDSNRIALLRLAEEAGARVIAATTVGDDRQATLRALEAGLADADVVMTSGGVSVGEHDLVRPALEALGVEERFWRVGMKPGGPTWFGTRGQAAVFGLPGNPVSAFVTFQLFVRPALRAMMGARPFPPRWQCVLDSTVVLGRKEQAIRVRVEGRADGTLAASATGDQGSHRSSSLRHAWGLALVPAGEGELPVGSLVAVEPFSD